jgi:uncharacterized protein (TIGR02646 family)
VDNYLVWAQEFSLARQDNPAYRFSWRNKDCYQGLRQVLSAMTQGRCSFCDGSVGSESRETVEHFRPKSLFPNLAYTWANLFICCDVCQGKGDRFDELLLKPDEQDYSFTRYFINNYKSGELEPNPAASEEDQQRAALTIDLYQLNKDRRKVLRLRELKCFKNRDEEDSIDDFNYRFFLE